MSIIDRPMTVDRAVNLVDRTIIDTADESLVMSLQDEWWESHRDEFHLEFEESVPDQWPDLIRRKREKIEGWVAERLREQMMVSGQVPYRLVS